MRKRVCGVWLVAAGEIVSWLPQVPLPAQAAKLGWYVLWCARAPPVNQFTMCTSTLLRLGVKRFHRVDAKCSTRSEPVDDYKPIDFENSRIMVCRMI